MADEAAMLLRKLNVEDAKILIPYSENHCYYSEVKKATDSI